MLHGLLPINSAKAIAPIPGESLTACCRLPEPNTYSGRPNLVSTLGLGLAALTKPRFPTDIANRVRGAHIIVQGMGSNCFSHDCRKDSVFPLAHPWPENGEITPLGLWSRPKESPVYVPFTEGERDHKIPS